MAKKLSEMTDEERYGKVGAQIRRLDPEAYKKRPRSAEGNLKLLKELQERSKTTPARTLSPDEFMSPASRRRMDEAPAAPASRGPSTRGGRRASAEETEANNRRITAVKASEAISRASRSGALPSDRATGFRSQAEQTGMSPDERAEKARDYSKDIAMTTGAAKLGAAAGAPYRLTSGAFRKTADEAAEATGRSLSRRGVPSYSERYAARESAAEQRRLAAEKAAEKAAQKERMERLSKLQEAAGVTSSGRRFARGGSVKSSASRRGDGIAKKGKTRGKFI
jgi:hypothetical protein